jgi:ergothioneine biosynthesis protein EgtB
MMTVNQQANMDLSGLYLKTRQDTLHLCEPLKIEDYLLQPVFFVSPAKWVLGHTSWFFEEMILKAHSPGYRTFHPKYSYLFNSYYNTLGERVVRHKRGDLSRPSVEEVLAYRSHVDEQMLAFLLSNEPNQELTYLVTLGINHEQQHQELLLTDLKYSFSVNPLFPAYTDTPLCEDAEAGNPEWISIEGGIRELGYQGTGFCFDNELPPHKVLIHPFSIRNTLVTNGEYMEFIEAGGYARFEYWHDDALAWLSENKIDKPLYWQQTDGAWQQFTLAGLRKVQPDHILTHVNYYEAAAFARWKECRLPTEFEWETAADQLDRGKRWEHTESAYLPYPGYQVAPGAVGEYNGKFMVNQMVLRGGSVATPEGHSRKTYRNFFHPDMGWQFNGIRLVK